MAGADPKDVSQKALSRGLPQLGTLGAGNHFIDVQVVDEIFDSETANVISALRRMYFTFLTFLGFNMPPYPISGIFATSYPPTTTIHFLLSNLEKKTATYAGNSANQQ